MDPTTTRAASALPPAALPTVADAARMLGVAVDALAGDLTVRLRPDEVLALNEQIRTRTRGELAGDLVDFAWLHAPATAPHVQAVVDAWLDTEPQSPFAQSPFLDATDLLACLRERLGPDRFRTVELLLARGSCSAPAVSVVADPHAGKSSSTI